MDWNCALKKAPYDTPLLLACGGVLVGHRVPGKNQDGFEFVDTEFRYLRPTHWMLAPEMPELQSSKL